MKESLHFESLKKIDLGSGPEKANDFLEALRRSGYDVTYFAKNLIGKRDFVVCQKQEEVGLIVTSPHKLGMRSGTVCAGYGIYRDCATDDEICNLAVRCGLELCPHEVAAQLCLQDGLPKGRCLFIGAAPIADIFGHRRIFQVRWEKGKRTLDAVRPPNSYRWSIYSDWVFLHRRTKRKST